MRKIRLEKECGLRPLASLMGISPSYLSDLELGKRAWNVKQQRSFMEALDNK